MEDLLSLCKVMQANMGMCPDLRILELQQGMRDVWEKMPEAFITRWRIVFTSHENKTGSCPSLNIFMNTLSSFVLECSNPNFITENAPSSSFPRNTRALKTVTEAFCIFHNLPGHAILDCGAFRKLSCKDRRQFAIDGKLCFSCLGEHRSRDCPNSVTCDSCNGNHHAVMHMDNWQPKRKYSEKSQNRERNDKLPYLRNNCNAVSSPQNVSKVCSKTVPVFLRAVNGKKTIKCLCIIDEQSDSTFCDTRIPAVLNLSPNECSYHLSTMSGLRTKFDGMEITNLEVRGFGEEKWIRLPTTFTHPSIPDTRSEVALPHVVNAHPHTRPYRSFFSKVDPDLECCCSLELTVARQCLLDVMAQRFPLFTTLVSVGPSSVLYHATRRILKKMAPPTEH